MNLSDNELIKLIQTAGPEDIYMQELGMHTLLMKHNPLVIHCAHKYSFNQIPFEDRYTVCQMAFTDAVKTVDLNKGALSTWVVWKCRAALTDLKREEYPEAEQSNAPTSQVDFMDAELELNESNTIDKPTTAFNVVELAEHQDIIFQAMAGLPSRDIDIFCHTHGILHHEELNGQELSERFGITPTRITQIVKSIEGLVGKRIRDNYSKQEVI